MLLNQQYQEVVRRDADLQIFGATEHRYIPARASLAEVCEFERWAGCALPADYRQFLIEIGSGVGPYYGLWSFGRIREELSLIYEDYFEEHHSVGRPCDPFGLEEPILVWQSSSTDLPKFFDASTSPGGFLPICHQGCEYVTLMVISGKLHGTVFEATNFGSAGCQWLPATRPPGIVPPLRDRHGLPKLSKLASFSEWFLGWTENALHDLNQRTPA